MAYNSAVSNSFYSDQRVPANNDYYYYYYDDTEPDLKYAPVPSDRDYSQVPSSSIEEQKIREIRNNHAIFR